MNLNVLFVHRKGVFIFKGGEQDQILNTKNALARLGVEATLAEEVPKDLSRFDLVHFFGLDACHIPEIRAAGDAVKVLTPVFWDRAQGYMLDNEYEEWPRPGRETTDKIRYWARRNLGKRNRRVARISKSHFVDALHRFGEFQNVIDDFDLFLPNSEAEMIALSSFYVISDPRHQVVPNAVDIEAVNNPSDFAQRNLPKDTPFVCCSGGIDRRKNQYSLVKAMLDVDVPLVFAGGARDSHYMTAVQAVAARRKGIYFLGHLEQRDLHSVYQAASVHALPSFHDTPGISNLEAVAHECNNVSTQIGGLREYLGEYGLYCNPFSVEHIRSQIVAALNLPPNVHGAERVKTRYTYDQVASATLAGYHRALELRD